MNFEELTKMYNEVAKTKSYCSHKNAEVFQDENGVFHFHCKDCGLAGMGDYKAALTLGWIL